MKNDLMPLGNKFARGGTAKSVGAASNQDPCHVRLIQLASERPSYCSAVTCSSQSTGFPSSFS
jgi:hypothetical protein